MCSSDLVGPPILAEALTAAAVVLARPAGVAAWLAWAGLALVGVIWLSTVSLQIPAHAALSSGFKPAVAASLVSSNWIRTVAWTLRAALVCAMLWQAASAARS